MPSRLVHSLRSTLTNYTVRKTTVVYITFLHKCITYMSLEAVECGSFTLDDAVLVLDSIFYCSSDHRVEFIFVMVCPGTG